MTETFKKFVENCKSLLEAIFYLGDRATFNIYIQVLQKSLYKVTRAEGDKFQGCILWLLSGKCFFNYEILPQIGHVTFKNGLRSVQVGQYN